MRWIKVTGWILVGAVLLVAVAAALAAARLEMAVRTRNAFTPRDLSHPLVGQPAPPLRLPRPDGGTVDLAELRGRTVAVTFWSTF